jgi:hypothetical protein
MKWTYTEKTHTGIFWEVQENGRHLLLFYQVSIGPDRVCGKFVWGGPYQGIKVQLDPFQLLLENNDYFLPPLNLADPLPVFVCQETPL